MLSYFHNFKKKSTTYFLKISVIEERERRDLFLKSGFFHIDEADFLSAIQYGHETIKDIVIMQEEIVNECGKKKREV